MRCIAIIAIIGLVGCNASSKPETILLGHLAPVDQDDAELRGVALAVEERNGVVDQRPLGRRILAVHAEVGSSESDYESQAVRLGVINRVSGLVGGVTARRAERISRADQSEQLPVFVLAGWSSAPLNPAVFHLGIPPRSLGTALARFSKTESQPKRVLVLVDGSEPIFNEMVIGMRKVWENDNSIIVREQQVNPTTSRIDLMKAITEFAPQAIFIAGRAALAIELRENGLRADSPLFLACEEPEVLMLLNAPQRADGIIVASSFAADQDREDVKKFVKSYQDHYSQAPTAISALAYEGTMIWANVVARTQGIETRKIRDELLKNGVDGLSGKITFTKDLHAQRPIQILKSTGNRYQLVRTFDTLE